MPKPFIDVNGKAMIEHVVNNVVPEDSKVYLLIRPEHINYFKETGLSTRDDIALVPIFELTEGAAVTVLRARGLIDTDEPLIIANSDQWVRYDSKAWESVIYSNVDASIMTLIGDHPKYSYARTNQNGRVIEVAEKRVISNTPTVGVYYYRRGSEFVWGAQSMIRKNIRTNGEFYVAPAFNELILAGRKITIFPVDGMFGMGSPEDLEANRKEIGT